MGRDMIVHKQSGLLLVVLWPSVLTAPAAMVPLSWLTPNKCLQLVPLQAFSELLAFGALPLCQQAENLLCFWRLSDMVLVLYHCPGLSQNTGHWRGEFQKTISLTWFLQALLSRIFIRERLSGRQGRPCSNSCFPFVIFPYHYLSFYMPGPQDWPNSCSASWVFRILCKPQDGHLSQCLQISSVSQEPSLPRIPG